jgi:hypothetical protein
MHNRQVPGTYDYVVFGGGIFGLYASKLLVEKGLQVLLIEFDPHLFSRASFINQARVHLGYHYPRSLATAMASIQAHERFVKEFAASIHSEFRKIYAISRRNSYTSAKHFLKFCSYVGIPLIELDPLSHFKPGVVEASFETKEYAFDAKAALATLLSRLEGKPNFTLRLGDRLKRAEKESAYFALELASGTRVRTRGVVNATYASVNQILEQFGFEKFKIKYEISEVALGKPSPELKGTGITVMDGPFFSTMPFGHTGQHSLTAVEFTPHQTSSEPLPTFGCQRTQGDCTPLSLQNCTTCPSRPRTAYPYMSQLARKYLKDSLYVSHESSLFAVKAILAAAETDDSRPTCLREASREPHFVSVLAGKINTIYELDEVLA